MLFAEHLYAKGDVDRMTRSGFPSAIEAYFGLRDHNVEKRSISGDWIEILLQVGRRFGGEVSRLPYANRLLGANLPRESLRSWRYAGQSKKMIRCVIGENVPRAVVFLCHPKRLPPG